MLIGYARVSTDDQDLRVQRAALKEAGCRRTFEEKVSGARRNRPELERMLEHLRDDDVVVVTRLDRLARSTRDLLDIAERLKEAGAGLRSMAEPWADTTSPAGRMVLTVFAGIAEFERELIYQRTSSGRVAGTYGCFLSKWQSAALRPIVLQPRLLKDFATELDTTTHDVADLVTAENDLVYLDPPYTKRQYASYYHIIETLVLGDEPRVEGVSGLRPWQHKASAFCYKRRALDALVSLVENIGSRHVILSYSAEGHVDLLELEEMLSRSGKIVTTPIEEVGRYRPNRSASANGDTVTEYILTYARRGARKSSPMPRNVILEGATA